MENLNDKESKKVYNIKGSNAFFRSKEDAKRYAELFGRSEGYVRALHIYEKWEDYVKDVPSDVITGLCLEKSNLCIVSLPFNIHYYHLKEGGTDVKSSSCDFWELKEMLSLANKQLKGKYDYPSDVKDDEKIKISVGNYSMELTARQFIELYKVYNDTCSKITSKNDEIKQAFKLGKESGKIDDEEFKSILNEYLVGEEQNLDRQEPLYLEMLEKDRYLGNNYLGLE